MVLAAQGFRPGLRTNAPIRGLKTCLQQAGKVDQNAVVFLDSVSIGLSWSQAKLARR